MRMPRLLMRSLGCCSSVTSERKHMKRRYFKVGVSHFRPLLCAIGLLLRTAVLCSAQVPVTEYPVPTVGAVPEEITAGPDGNLWFVETSKIGKITTAGLI